MQLKKRLEKKKSNQEGMKYVELQRMLQERYGEYNQAISDFFFSKSNL